ncbi:3-hydroxyacyl-CoA dehydrogenase [Xanthobacter sp. TB0136]|uniref:3-hydroxyacyl-CoA dehydrogenase n=1 Tax=Xanthobacter sp. TB0136 TaxID=3459177 RepID=UPI00403A58AF
MTRIAIVGAGLIGRSWAYVFARAGMDVKVWDPEAAVLERLGDDVRAMHAKATAHGRSGDDPDGLPGRVHACPDLGEAVKDVDLVQENGPEVLDVKQRLFADLDRLAAPETILASSSSALMASTFTADLEGRARCLIGHPVNPPHLVPVVEICPTPYTAADVTEKASAIYRQSGQVPVLLNREIDGFVLNRLQAVVLAESLRLINEGICSPEGLDDTIKHGLGRRWAFMGPMETIHLNAQGGIQDYLERLGPTMARLANDAARGEAFTPEAARKVSVGFKDDTRADIRARQEWRDGELAALDRHLLNRASEKA